MDPKKWIESPPPWGDPLWQPAHKVLARSGEELTEERLESNLFALGFVYSGWPNLFRRLSWVEVAIFASICLGAMRDHNASLEDVSSVLDVTKPHDMDAVDKELFGRIQSFL